MMVSTSGFLRLLRGSLTFTILDRIAVSSYLEVSEGGDSAGRSFLSFWRNWRSLLVYSEVRLRLRNKVPPIEGLVFEEGEYTLWPLVDLLAEAGRRNIVLSPGDLPLLGDQQVSMQTGRLRRLLVIELSEEVVPVQPVEKAPAHSERVLKFIMDDDGEWLPGGLISPTAVYATVDAIPRGGFTVSGVSGGGHRIQMGSGKLDGLLAEGSGRI
jgi:hypothetical protein